MPASILIITENGADSVAGLSRVLTEDGHQPSVAAGWGEGWKQFEKLRPAMVVLDLGPKPKRGLEVCSKVRAHPTLSTASVVLLAVDGGIEEKERGFSAGADLYLTKPFDDKRLRLWVTALLRRARSDEKEGGVLRAEDFVIDPRAKTVKTGGQLIRDLTQKEFQLLYELVRRRPRTLSKEFIMRSLWNSILRDNTVEVHVWNLRKKLGPAGGRILTVAKAGYRFA
ncbi:MAG: response regulator transcription factor [Elusimicrobia bacterium]|nr:response regulator transcription factor [Elusimicrobiota bacterium]